MRKLHFNFKILPSEIIINFDTYAKLKKNIKLIIIYMIAVFFYYLSLRSINGAKLKCFKKKNIACFSTIVRLIIVSSCLITFSIYMILFNKIYLKFHYFILIIMYSIFIYKDHNTNLTNHGLFYKKYI